MIIFAKQTVKIKVGFGPRRFMKINETKMHKNSTNDRGGKTLRNPLPGIPNVRVFAGN